MRTYPHKGRRPMSTDWKGRCLCGAVQYNARGGALAQLVCHCRDCQRASGSAGLPVVVVSADEFSFEGEIRSYTMTGGSGMPTTRNFCAHCSSLLFGTPQHAPDIVTIYAGTLDEPSRFHAEFVQFTCERHQLDARGPSVAQHTGRAP
ncbi:GFA family protein [Paraburkholderia sp. EG287B]|uniref:GFA family protein n=1 Tax=Paraburkholderia sp. EG287B TaxID=3237010 RepID=UPI0034D1663F